MPDNRFHQRRMGGGTFLRHPLHQEVRLDNHFHTGLQNFVQMKLHKMRVYTLLDNFLLIASRVSDGNQTASKPF